MALSGFDTKYTVGTSHTVSGAPSPSLLDSLLPTTVLIQLSSNTSTFLIPSLDVGE